MRTAFEIAGQRVPPGKSTLIDIPVARLSNHTPVTLPVHVIHGRRDGPTLFVCAAIHGDEVIGVEIIRRLLRSKGLRSIRGTLLCVPIVNAFGFINRSRYLPDRRDLNRSFPGSESGSLAAQLANLFLREIVKRSDMGIDLHTGAINRSNLPQLRGDFSDPELRAHALAFGAPIVLQSNLREGSLREAAHSEGVNVLLYEGGEALRLDELAVRVGVKGILRIMRRLGMTATRASTPAPIASTFSRSSRWLRAPQSGILRTYKALGDTVASVDVLGAVTNPYEDISMEVTPEFSGVVIGRTNISVVNRGDALFHVAKVARPDAVEGRFEQIADDLGGDPIFDEDEII